jgi:uncharacterized CHY-type Zn-finger protein
MAKSTNTNIPRLTEDQMQKLTTAMQNAVDIKCSCGNPTFYEGFRVKKLSRLILGTPNDEIVPIPTMLCCVCNKEVTSTETDESATKPEGVIEIDFRNKK